MKRGEEIMSFIRCQNKIGNEQMTEVLHTINNIVFHYNKSFIAPATAATIYNSMVQCGQQLKDIKTTDKQNPKKQEMLTQLRTICQNVRTYSKTQLTDSDLPQIKAAMKYRIYKFLEAKRNSHLTDSEILEHLRTNNEIWLDMVQPLKANFTDKELKDFRDINSQLLTVLYNRYYEQAQ